MSEYFIVPIHSTCICDMIKTQNTNLKFLECENTPLPSLRNSKQRLNMGTAHNKGTQKAMINHSSYCIPIFNED